MYNPKNRKTRSNRYSTSGLDMVIYGLVTAIILIVLLIVWVSLTKKNTNDKAQETVYEQDHGSPSEFNDEKAGAVLTAPEDTEKNQNPTEEGSSGATGEEDEDIANEQQSSSATPWFLISVLTLSTAANGSIAIFIFRHNRQSDKLHRERIKFLNDRKYVEPEALQKTMCDLNEKAKALDKQLSELKQNNDRTVQSLAQQTSTAISRFEKDNQQTGEKIQEIMNALSVFKESLDDKDEEIKRYKEGHDSKLISKYILSYIKVRDQIIKMTNSDQLEFKNLEQLADRLSMEIDHAGVKEIEVSVGDKFLDDKYGGKLAAPKLVPTDVPENEGTIKSVDLAGYEFTGNEKNMILRLAKVSVYELEQVK